MRAAALAAWCAAWLCVLLAASVALPVDNAEQLTWVRSLQWGYHKHPPLPTWLIWAPVQVFGLQPAVSLVMGAALNGLALWMFGDLLERLGGRRWAWLGLVAACCIVYYSSRQHFYNHNVVMLPCTVAAACCLWRAWNGHGRRWWVLLGLALGLGLLAKYQAITTVLSVLVFAAWGRVWNHPARRWGLAAALLVAGCVTAPHLAWLLTHPVNPLGYFQESTLQVELSAWQRLRLWGAWWADMTLVRSGAALLWCAAVLVWWRRAPVDTGVALPAEGLRLLWVWALVPQVVVFVLAVVMGSTIRPHWATPMALWWMPLVLATLAGKAPTRSLKPLVVMAVVLQVALAAQVVWSERQSALHETPRWGRPMPERWAEGVATLARRELGGDIRVVLGPETVAAAFALSVPERPYVVLDGRREVSPWLPPELPGLCGVLFIVFGTPGVDGQAIEAGPPGMVWRVVPPDHGGGCKGDAKRTTGG